MSILNDRTLLKASIASLAVHAFLLADVAPFLPLKPEAPPTAMAVSFRAPVPERPQARARSTEYLQNQPKVLKQHIRLIRSYLIKQAR